jgi:hypothetical protein
LAEELAAHNLQALLQAAIVSDSIARASSKVKRA